MSIELKPCPACGGVPKRYDRFIFCFSKGCHVSGPYDDQDGSKWNALPRRDDVHETLEDKVIREAHQKYLKNNKITKRDLFAAAVLVGVNLNQFGFDTTAEQCFAAADKMIEESLK